MVVPSDEGETGALALVMDFFLVLPPVRASNFFFLSLCGAETLHAKCGAN